MEEEKQKAVRNRDIPLLMDVVGMMESVHMLEDRREWQKSRLYNITSILTGMPRGGSGENKYEIVFSELSELDEMHADRIRQYVRAMKRAERIINGISSQTMRAFVIMRYMMDASNTDIMETLNMSRRGFERAVKSVEEARNMKAVVWRERYILKDE